MKNYTSTNHNVIAFDPTSLSYAWKYRNYLFIQLHNYPTYHVEYERLSLTLKRKKIKIDSSIPWLKKLLQENNSPDTNIVLNFHDLGDQFSQKKRPQEYEQFVNIMAQAPNVRAIFVGHIHKSVGEIKPLTVSKKKRIPVFRSGSASYNLMNLVRFYQDKIVVNPVSTVDGTLTYLDKESTVQF